MAQWIEAHIESEHFDASTLHLRDLTLTEAISQFFEATLTLVAEAGSNIPLADLVGAEVTLVLTSRGDGSVGAQRIHGVLAQVRALDYVAGAAATISATLRPLAWMMHLVETLDIYIDETIPQILKRKLALIDLAEGNDYELRLGDYAKREFVVQYRETDHDFIKRLNEHYGIAFFFEHRKDSSCLVFADDSNAYREVAGGAVCYRRGAEERAVYRLEEELNLVPRTYVCRDYNYRTPTIELQAEHVLDEGVGGGVIDYGAHFKTREEAAHFARVRAEERLAAQHVFNGDSSCIDFHAGQRVTLEEHPRCNESLLLVKVTHQLAQPHPGADNDSGVGYRNSFQAVPASRTYRPPRISPRPRIHGVVTGIVETRQGDVGNVAQLDEHGRYRVRFLFDTAATGERQASKRVRQLQPSAGPGYGMHFPLKPGVEVALAFVDGDPDRPLIVGAVPNPITPTPVVSKNATSNRIHTRSGIIVEFEDGFVAR